MSLWIAAAALALAAAAWMVRPLLRRAEVEPNETTREVSIYRDQLEEVERDAAAGLISAAERDAAEQEIEGRALRAARRFDASLEVARRSPALAAASVASCLVGAFGLYAALGAPQAEDRPFAARQMEILERRAAAGDPTSRIALLQKRAEENADSLDAWWRLAKGYAAVGDHASAADAYRRAAALAEDEPAVLSAYAEAMTLANGNKVPAAAKLIFQQVRAKNGDPRARYYLALAKAQAKDFEGALADWVALRADSTLDAPWMRLVRRDIANMARFLKRDVKSVLPDATDAELAHAGAAVDATEVEARIAALEATLAAEPRDYKTSIELARLRASLAQDDKARAVLAAARERYAAAPFVVSRLDQAARSLGLAAQPSAAAKGPSDADVAAAADMTQEQRDAMVIGMVDGLAARLEHDPRNLDGWLMLIRSYAVLQKPEKAMSAARSALDAFGDDAGAAERVTRLAEEFGLSVAKTP